MTTQVTVATAEAALASGEYALAEQLALAWQNERRRDVLTEESAALWRRCNEVIAASRQARVERVPARPRTVYLACDCQGTPHSAHLTRSAAAGTHLVSAAWGSVREVPVDPDGGCWDPSAHVRYPRHEEYVPGGCTCVRCGEITDAARAVRDLSPADILRRQS